MYLHQKRHKRPAALLCCTPWHTLAHILAREAPMLWSLDPVDPNKYSKQIACLLNGSNCSSRNTSLRGASRNAKPVRKLSEENKKRVELAGGVHELSSPTPPTSWGMLLRSLEETHSMSYA